MAETKNTSGVQELINRIRDQGVQAARSEGEQLLLEARQQANELIAQARAESDAIREKTQADMEAYKTASLDALASGGARLCA